MSVSDEGLRIRDGRVLDFLATDWEMEMDEEDGSVRFTHEGTGNSIELRSDGTFHAPGQSLVTQLLVGGEWEIESAGSDLVFVNANTQEEFRYGEDGSLSLPNVFDWVDDGTEFDWLTVQDLDITNAITDPEGEVVKELSALGIGAIERAQFNVLVRDLAEAQFELGLTQLDFRAGTYDIFVDGGTYQQSQNIYQLEDSITLVEGETTGSVTYTDEEFDFLVEEAVLSVDGSELDGVHMVVTDLDNNEFTLEQRDEIYETNFTNDIDTVELVLERSTTDDPAPEVQDFAVYFTGDAQ